jgi:hypothetical protein
MFRMLYQDYGNTVIIVDFSMPSLVEDQSIPFHQMVSSASHVW